MLAANMPASTLSRSRAIEQRRRRGRGGRPLSLRSGSFAGQIYAGRGLQKCRAMPLRGLHWRRLARRSLFHLSRPPSWFDAHLELRFAVAASRDFRQGERRPNRSGGRGSHDAGGRDAIPAVKILTPLRGLQPGHLGRSPFVSEGARRQPAIWPGSALFDRRKLQRPKSPDDRFGRGFLPSSTS
jgi:hypothetical protein